MMGKATPLNAELLGVAKGHAAPAEPPVILTLPESSSGQGRGTTLHGAPTRTKVGKKERPSWRSVDPEPEEEPRQAVTVRLPMSMVKRLRRAAFESETEIQKIVEDVVGKALGEAGF